MTRLLYSYTAVRLLSYQRTKRLNCTPKEIFEIVLNVSDYKKFIPYVKESNHQLQYQLTDQQHLQQPVDGQIIRGSVNAGDTRPIATRDLKGRGIRGIRGIKGIKKLLGASQSTSPSMDSDQSSTPVEGTYGTGQGYFTTYWSLYKEKLECELEFKVNEYVISHCKNDLFNYLHCQWSFHPVRNQLTNQNQCDVEISLDYEFNNFIYNNLSALFTSQISEIMVKSFETRLKQQRDNNNFL